MLKQNKTYSAKPAEALADRKWYVVDGEGVVLGRLAADVAAILRGKHKPTYTPHVDCGDHVVITNADKLVLTAGKGDKKIRYRHSGYPGGLKEEPYGKLFEKDPARAVRTAVKGMLPHNTLGREMIRKLKVHVGPDHPHAAQGPVALELPHLRKIEVSE